MGTRTRRHRPRSGRRDRRQHGAPGRGDRAWRTRSSPLLDRPGAFVFGSNDYRGPVFKNPLGYFDRDREYVQGVELPYEDLRELFRQRRLG